MVSNSTHVLTPDEHREQQQRKGPLSFGLESSVSVPPGWTTTFSSTLPAFGVYMDIFTNISRYDVNTEDVAEFVVSSILDATNKFKNQRVGVKYQKSGR